MNKKIIGLWIVGILVMSFAATALLVSYLSNEQKVNVNVVSPISLSNDNVVLAVFGGENITFDTVLTNNADASITGSVISLIVNPLGLGCVDFNYINATIDGVESDVLAGCSVIDANNIQLDIYGGPKTWSALEANNVSIEIGFKSNAIGEYNITTQVMV